MIKKIFNSFQKENKDLQTYLNNKAVIDQFLEYLTWETHIPVPHAVKQNNIRKYQETYQYQVFVETGTYLGDMVEAQKDRFRRVISIELGKDLHQKALQRFENDPQVTLLQGDSGMLLKEVIKNMDEPALFWLDGHFSSGITAKSDKNTPIVEELKAILGSSINHGILIDDARLFTGKDDYPSIDEICFIVKEYSPNKKVEVADDIIRIMP